MRGAVLLFDVTPLTKPHHLVVLSHELATRDTTPVPVCGVGSCGNCSFSSGFEVHAGRLPRVIGFWFHYVCKTETTALKISVAGPMARGKPSSHVYDDDDYYDGYEDDYQEDEWEDEEGDSDAVSYPSHQSNSTASGSSASSSKNPKPDSTKAVAVSKAAGASQSVEKGIQTLNIAAKSGTHKTTSSTSIGNSGATIASKGTVTDKSCNGAARQQVAPGPLGAGDGERRVEEGRNKPSATEETVAVVAEREEKRRAALRTYEGEEWMKEMANEEAAEKPTLHLIVVCLPKHSI